MRNRISPYQRPSLMIVTEVSGVLAMPFALGTTPCLRNPRDVVPKPEWPADDLRSFPSKVIHTIFPHARLIKQFMCQVEGLRFSLVTVTARGEVGEVPSASRVTA